MVSVKKIKYVDATIRQVARMKIKTNNINPIAGETHDYKTTLKSMKKADKLERFPQYDSFGKPTEVGKKRRLLTLAEMNLPDDTTLADFFKVKKEKFMKELLKKLDEIHEAFKNR